MSKQNIPAAGLEPIEKASKDELQALQLQRMKWSLKHAYDNVPHYRKKYDAAGVHPDDLKQLSDLAKFPFTTKLDLRDTYPFGMFATPMKDVVRIHASSGTTGKPTVVAYTKNDIAMWAHSWRARCAPPAAVPTTSSSIPTATACLPAASAPTTAARPRRHGDPDVRRPDRKAGATDPGLQADGDHAARRPTC
jgi:phenylacetate-coenzyme A ligase PaaK-like adenylate-forming protein